MESSITIDNEPQGFREKSSYSPDIHRLLPQSQDAELGILGSILLCPQQVMGECVEKCVTPEHFHVPAHATIFETLRELYDNGIPIDFILLTKILRDRQLLDRVGGPAFVTSLFTFVPTAANSAYYLEILKEKHTLRQTILTCNEFSALAYEDQPDVDGFVDRLENRVGAIAAARFGSAKFDIKKVAMDALEAIEQLYERKGVISGLATGFRDLDILTDGMHASEMWVIAARPSQGKTALGMNIAEHVAIDQERPVGVFSLEMSTEQLGQRIICSRGKINMQGLRAGYLSEGDFPRLSNAGAALAQSKLLIDDTAGLTILELKARARKWKREYGIELIVIDYLQLVQGASKRAKENRVLEIGEISAGIKGLAKELKIPIIALAQINRKAEDRPGGKPRMSDLRESGNIEQDADLIAMIHRPEIYAKDDEEKNELAGEADLIITKSRNGPLDTIALTFLNQFCRFEDRARMPKQS